MILHGKHLKKVWTKQQSIVATSSSEAELYACNRAATESMGVQAFPKDLGGSRHDSAAHRLQCGTINYKRNRAGQSEAHRDPALVAPGGGP